MSTSTRVMSDSATVKAVLPSPVVGGPGRGDLQLVGQAALGAEASAHSCRTVAMELAYEEYRRREAQGEELSAESFSRRYPSLQRSLCLFIEVKKLLDREQGALPGTQKIVWPESDDEFLGFSLIEELGRGTFARVFLASEPALGGRLVALKVAWHGTMEAEVLGKLQHPNVVPVHSVRQDPETGFSAVCMSYLGRATLADVLDRVFEAGIPRKARVILDAIHSVPRSLEGLESARPDRALLKGSYTDAVIHLGAQIADALRYTHGRGVVHQDLKPSNVLFTPRGRPLLLDFNIASDASLQISRVGGTLPYIAPEQISAFVEQQLPADRPADPRTDLFSLGVILYELLSGELPFELDFAEATLEKTAERLRERQRKGPRPLRAANPSIDDSLAKLIERCLAFDPEARPASAEELAAALRKEQATLRRARRSIREHRVLTALASLPLALVAALGIMMLATNEPYDVRQYRHGLACLEAGQYEQAIQSFTNAAGAAPDRYDALLARGRAYSKSGDPRLAFVDYQEAYRLKKTAEAAVGKAYSAHLLRFKQDAASFYVDAINLGANSAAVYNNLGYARAQIDGGAGAEKYLEQAIAIDPDCHPAYRTLAIIRLKSARLGKKSLADVLPIIRKAIALAPPNAETYRDAAIIYQLAAEQGLETQQTAIAHLRQSLALGMPSERIRNDPVLAPLLDRVGKIHRDPNAETRVEAVTILDPLDTPPLDGQSS